MNTDKMKGIIVPILTPIDDEEHIDETVLRKQIDFVILGGVQGVLAYGSNGEFYAVEEEELERGLTIMLEQTRGRAPVYMGIGAVNTNKCIRIAKMAQKAGAAGISVLQPMFLAPNYTEQHTHFKAIADAVPEMPTLLYNNPARTGYTISADLVEDLARGVDNIVGIKDSSGDMTLTAEYIRRTRDIDFKVFGGKDTLIYGALAHGASGCVATTANFVPWLVCSIYDRYVTGDITGALQAQYDLDPIRLVMDKASFPVGTKDLANIAGLKVGKPYLPNLPTSEGSVLDAMRKVMAPYII